MSEEIEVRVEEWVRRKKRGFMNTFAIAAVIALWVMFALAFVKTHW